MDKFKEKVNSLRADLDKALAQIETLQEITQKCSTCKQLVNETSLSELVQTKITTKQELLAQLDNCTKKKSLVAQKLNQWTLLIQKQKNN